MRIFVRAAGLDFEEVDVWGSTHTPEFLAKNPAHLTPMIEQAGLPRATLWESCAIMAVPLQHARPEQFYPSDPGKRAMIDSAKFYLIGTLYPLLARATYPALNFPQYPGEVGSSNADDAAKAEAQQICEAALAEPLDVYRAFFLDGKRFIGGDHPSIADIRLAAIARVPARDRLRLAGVGQGVHGRDGPSRSATRTPSRPPTCAATSSTCARRRRPRSHAHVGTVPD